MFSHFFSKLNHWFTSESAEVQHLFGSREHESFAGLCSQCVLLQVIRPVVQGEDRLKPEYNGVYQGWFKISNFKGKKFC